MIAVLEDINDKLGKCVVLVTHDPYVASFCNRILFLKDGVIAQDLRKKSCREQFYDRVIEVQKEILEG